MVHTPAAETNPGWLGEALPIGNGQLGCMVRGGIARENIQFNEDTVWIGDETNMYGFHPPFQIDCNFAYAAGVNEMLVQSHMGYIHLLPSLPKAWPTGKIKGLRVRGGYEMDIEWKDGKLTRAVIRNVSNPTGECEVRYGEKTGKILVPRGESREFTGNEKLTQ